MTVTAAERRCRAARSGRLRWVLGLLSLTGCFVERAPEARWLEGDGVRATLSPDGLTLSRNGDTLSLRVTALTRAGQPAPLTEARVLAAPDRQLRLDRGAGVIEWLTIHQGLLEHGLTLEERPRGTGLLSVDLEVLGATPALLDGAVALRSAQGDLLYGGLVTRDAEGRELPSRLTVAGSQIRLVFDDSDARYPVLVDPTVWVEGGELGAQTPDRPALALSGDRLVIGRPEFPDHGEISTVGRSGYTWSETTHNPPPAAWEQLFGQRVALEGSWLAVASGPPAAIDIFHAPDLVWHFDGHLDLLAPVHAVALHGSTVAVGLGGSVVFVENTGAGWSVTQVFSPAQPSAGFGEALVFDGERLLVGAIDDASTLGFASGAVFELERIDGVWTLTQALTASDAAALDGFGLSLAVDGERLVVGSGLSGQSVGRCAVYVFERSPGSPWSEVARLAGADPTVPDGFGAAVALRGDTIVVGAPDAGDVPSNGAVYTFERTAGAWVPAPILAPQLAEKAQFGFQVALTSDQLFVADRLGTTHVHHAVGRPCSDAAVCPTGFCVDGFCCDSECSGSCEACNVSFREGLCSPIVGEPAAGHPPCAPGSCTDGIATGASTCEGGPTCEAGVTQSCVPYRCGADRCLDSCDSDASCAPGHACDTTIHGCVSQAAVCDGDHTLHAPNGDSIDCAPFRCADGRCEQPCTSTEECVTGYVCDSRGRCVSQKGASAADGCTCSWPGSTPSGASWTSCVGLALAVAARLRRRTAA